MSQKLEKMADALEDYLKTNKISQNKLADLIGTPSSYITHALNRNWENVPAGKNRTTKFSEGQYRKFAIFLGLEEELVWDIQNTVRITTVLLEAKKYKEHRIISGETGTSKTYSCEAFQKEIPNETFLITASEDMNPKAFIVELAEKVKVDSTGDRRKIRLAICNKLKTMSNPIIIIDEAENLKNAAYGAIKAIYDNVKNYCGIVFVGANDFLKTLEKKAKSKKGCFPQLYSRFSAEALELSTMSKSEVKYIAGLNEIVDSATVNDLYSTCGDFRELDRKIKRLLKDNDLDQAA